MSQRKQVLETIRTSFSERLDADVKSMLVNFDEIIKASQPSMIEQYDQENRPELSDQTIIVRERYEMDVRAHNIVKSAENLLRLIGELKELLVFQDFKSLHESVTKRKDELNKCTEKTELKLKQISFEMNAHLHELEKHFTNTSCLP